MLRIEEGKGVSYYDASIAWFFLRQMFFSFTFCFSSVFAPHPGRQSTLAPLGESQTESQWAADPSPLPLSLSSMYNVFCIYCTTKPSPCAVTVRRCSCFCFRFCCCSQRAMHTHNPCSSRRTRVWVSESALLCKCVCVYVRCLSTGNPYAAMLGVSLLLWLHSPAAAFQWAPIQQPSKRERPSQRERANDGKCLWESASISSSVDDTVCLRRPPVWATLC